MCLKKITLVQEWSDNSNGPSIHSTMFEVINNHSTNSCFNEVLVTVPLPFFDFQRHYDSICFEESYASLFDFF